jgi:hypothetical protein
MLNIDALPSMVEPEQADNATSSNARPWKFFVDEINTIWRKGAQDYIACGQYLIEAKEELHRNVFDAMVKTKLDFDASVARKLMCIAANPLLCAHVHRLPPSWSTLYELSQLRGEVLKAAIDDGRVHPGMERKHAIALKPKTTTTPAATSTTNSPDLSAAWEAAIKDQRRRFLDKLGRDCLCAAMSDNLKADFRDHAIGVTIAGASKSSSWAINATNKLHSAMRIAEQPERDHESIGRLIGALRCIALTAERRGIARSDIVIAEGKPRKGKK